MLQDLLLIVKIAIYATSGEMKVYFGNYALKNGVLQRAI